MNKVPALILLAAGGSTRMGRAKQLLPYRGVTLLHHAVDVALASRCRPIAVVIGSEDAQMRAELCGMPVQIVSNPQWEEGMGSSIRAGMTALLAGGIPTAVVIMLCDQPGVTAELLNRLIDQYESEHASIIASAYAGIRGVPALFDRALFEELLHLSASMGAKELIQRHGDRLGQVEFAQGVVDVDTPADYERLT